MATPTPAQGAFTPRQRQEIEAPSLLQSRQEIPLIRAQTTFTTLVTARADAFFLTDALWMTETSGTARTVSVCLVPPAGSPTAANAVSWQVPLDANVSDFVIGGSGLLIPPGYTLQANASANDVVNLYGWGWNVIGDAGK
jgi:hypothetical protein